MQNYLTNTYLVHAHIRDLQASAHDIQIAPFGQYPTWKDKTMNRLGDALIALGSHLKSLPNPADQAACEA